MGFAKLIRCTNFKLTHYRKFDVLKQRLVSVTADGMSSVKNKFPSMEILRPGVLRDRFVPGVALILSLLCMLLGCSCFVSQSIDIYAAVFLSFLSLSLLLLFFYIYLTEGKWDRKFLALVILAGISTTVLWTIPEYIYFPLGVSAIFHRSVFSAALLLCISVPSICVSLNHFLGAGPRSQDASRSSLLVITILFALILYSLFIYYVIAHGAANLSWSSISTQYKSTSYLEMAYQDGWPVFTTNTIMLTGLRDYLLGSLLLIGMTAAISLPLGVGTGVYLSEYSRGGFSSMVRFSTRALRAVSVLILAVGALSLVNYTYGTPLQDLFSGFYRDYSGAKHAGHGSFILAAIFLSLLVIPVISRCTEEGLRSLPNDLREGSLALGASQEYALLRIMLPWATPNIITGLLLGCAEVAGAVGVILFISGVGGYGVNPLGETTSLGYMDWYLTSESTSFRNAMVGYRWSAAFLLLLIALGLTIGSIVLKQKFSKRYRGA